MNRPQRDIVALVSLVLAGVLLVTYFGVDFVRWLTWRPPHDLFSQIIAVRPGFPNGWRNVVLGLILPVLLAGFGFYLRSGDDRRP